MATLRLKNDRTIKLENDIYSNKAIQNLEAFDCKIINIKLNPYTKIIITSNYKCDDIEYINNSDKKVRKSVNIKLGSNPKIIVSRTIEEGIFLPQEISKVHNCNKCFNLKTSFIAQDVNFIYQGEPFNLTLTVRVDNNIVSIGIPALNFTLPVDGSLVTSSGQIPKRLRPQQSIPQSYTLETIGYGKNFNLYVSSDGSISIYDLGPATISAGTYNTNTKTISYILPCFKTKPPRNYELSKGLSNGPHYDPNAFLEFYNSDFVDNIVAFCWADNHDLITPINPIEINLNCVVRIGKIKKCKDGKVKIKLQEPVTVLAPPIQPFKISCAEQCISINPTNRYNIITLITYRDRNFPRLSKESLQLWSGISYDGGKIWPVVRRIDVSPITMLPDTYYFRADPNGTFDKFGNYWAVYMVHIADDLKDGNSLAITVSKDQGLTFEVVAIFYPEGQFTFGNVFDYPRIDFGGDGNGEYALWYVATLNSFTNANSTSDTYVGYIKISSNGIIDNSSATFVKMSVAGKDNYSNLSEISASPNGTVRISLAKTSTPFLGNQVVLFELVGGVNNFPNYTLVGPIEQNNLPFSFSPTAGLGQPPVSFQTVRGVPSFGARGLEYDANRNRLWALFPDKHPSKSDDMIIYIQFSDNEGKTWSQVIQISDTDKKARAIVGFKINKATGDLIISWYDARNSPDGSEAEYFYTYVSAQLADKLID